MTPNDLGLLGILRRAWDPQAPAPETDALDWTEVVRKAIDHGVAGLLCRAVERLPEAGLPAGLQEAARAYLEHAETEGAARVEQTFDVLAALAASDIPALAFKGVALAAMAHASAAIRPSRDIDVLVHRRDMPHAVTALKRLGYRASDTFGPRVMGACYATYGQDILFSNGRLPVEPHCAFAPRSLAIDIDVDDMWRRSTLLRIGSTDMRTLCAEDALVVACLHGAKEKWWRLLWVADVAALIHRYPDIDWKAIVRRASDAGMLRILELGIGLAKSLFGTRLPVDLGGSIERDAVCERLVGECKRRLFGEAGGPGSVFQVSRFHWDARERVGDRLRYVWRTVTTPQFIHYRMVPLPDPLVLGYVPVKLVHDYLMLPLWSLGKGRWWKTPRAHAEPRES